MLIAKQLTQSIIGAAIEVHRALGPGLLESAYEQCLYHGLLSRGLHTSRQVGMPVESKGVKIDCGDRLDLLVEWVVVVELKAIEKLLPVHEAQLLTDLKFSGHRVGLLINFHVQVLTNGLRRFVLQSLYSSMLSVCSVVNSGSAMTDNITRSTRAAEPVGAYPHARRAGNLLFLAGVGPRRRGSKDIPGVRLDADGNMIDYDIEPQIRSCFDNVRTILEEAGSRWENIIDVLVFLTDMKRDFAVYNRVWAEYFPPGPSQPTRTTIEVGALPQGGNAPIAFEVKVVATID